MKLGFTTLGCPGWNLRTVVTRAKEYGYDGFDLRGLLDEMYIPRIPAFSSQAKETRKLLEGEGLEISALSSSASFTHEKREDLGASMNEARDYIHCAAALGSPIVRVFGGAIPAGRTVDDVVPQVIDALSVLAREADDCDVTLVLESHDDWTDSRNLRKVLEGVEHPRLRALWDLNHPYRAAHEAPRDTIALIGRYISYTHCKDSIVDAAGGVRYTLMGQGTLPWRQMLDLLRAGGYDGYLTLEWEKRWHMDLPEPEVAFPVFVRLIKEYLASV